MASAEIDAELVMAVDGHINKKYYEALLQAFVAALLPRGIELAPTHDGGEPCVLRPSEIRAAGFAVVWARTHFIRPAAPPHKLELWAQSDARWGEGAAWVDRLVAALESQGRQLVVVDQAARENSAVFDDHCDEVLDCLEPPKFAGPILVDATLRREIFKAIERAGGDAEAATDAVCRVLDLAQPASVAASSQGRK